jgi:hypothetical protein
VASNIGNPALASVFLLQNKQHELLFSNVIENITPLYSVPCKQHCIFLKVTAHEKDVSPI